MLEVDQGFPSYKAGLLEEKAVNNKQHAAAVNLAPTVNEEPYLAFSVPHLINN